MSGKKEEEKEGEEEMRLCRKCGYENPGKGELITMYEGKMLCGCDNGNVNGKPMKFNKVKIMNKIKRAKKTEIQKSQSKFQKTVNRLRKVLKNLKKVVERRKKQNTYDADLKALFLLTHPKEYSKIVDKLNKMSKNELFKLRRELSKLIKTKKEKK